MSLGLHSLGFASLGLPFGKPRTDYGLTEFFAKPNWVSPVVETYTWLTDVMEAINGKEQRRGLRQTPRRTLSFETLMDGLAAQKLQSLFYGFGHKTFAVPNWLCVTPLAAPVSQDATVLMLDTLQKGFSAGGFIALMVGDDSEVLKISSVEPDKLILIEGAFYAWPAGALVIPLVFASLENIDLDKFTSSIFTAKIQLNIIDQDSHSLLPAELPAVSYLGYEVLTDRHNWRDGTGMSITHQADILDFNVGVVAKYHRKKHAKTIRNFKYLLHTLTQKYHFMAFLNRCKGKLTPFWFSANDDDFYIADAILANSLVLKVKGDNHALFTGVGKGLDHIKISLRAGQVFYRQVTELTTESGNTLMLLNAPLGVDVGVDDVIAISHLQLVRLAADQVTISWETGLIAEPELFFESVIV